LQENDPGSKTKSELFLSSFGGFPAEGPENPVDEDDAGGYESTLWAVNDGRLIG